MYAIDGDEKEEQIKLKNCRHPCVEVQDDIDFQPNSAYLNKTDRQFQIITGPNMGGKSTFIRQVAINILMAQIGCFIPSDSNSTVSVRNAILARIGAADCQLRGISTFMSEMLETNSIISTADSKSLIIIDELGRGTSTSDGYGLARAISEYIINKIGAFTLFATHFHELIDLQYFYPTKAFNLSMHSLFENGKLKMTYKIEEGGVEESFGIHVAKLADFPDKVIKIAEKKSLQLNKLANQDMNNQNENEEQKDNQEQNEQELKKINYVLWKFCNADLKSMNHEELKEFFSNLSEPTPQQYNYN
jgi:DNA mismatch repair protein MSH2